MVSASSTTFLLIFILLPLRFSSADTSQHQDNKMTLVVATGGKLEKARSPVNVEQAVVETDQRTRFVPGRKMMSRGVLSKSNVEESENGIINMAKGLTTCVIGKCNREKGKGILSVKHKFSKRNVHHTKVKMSDLVPLNADYFVPRPHPPKNN